MRKRVLFMIAALFLNAACADPVPPRLMRSIKSHHVRKAELKKGELYLATTHEAVSPGIYEKVIREGACSVLLAHPEKGWGKARIERIAVLDRNERQGYIFADARPACLELEKITDEEKRRAYFSGQTGICTAGICNDPEPAEPGKGKK